MTITVAGSPQCFSEVVTRVPRRIECHSGKELNIRNVSMNTLWVSLDGVAEFDVASGTSFDARLEFDGVWVRTKFGVTKVVGLVTS